MTLAAIFFWNAKIHIRVIKHYLMKSIGMVFLLTNQAKNGIQLLIHIFAINAALEVFVCKDVKIYFWFLTLIGGRNVSCAELPALCYDFMGMCELQLASCVNHESCR